MWWYVAEESCLLLMASALVNELLSVMQPRFAMTAAMAFFSLSVMVNLSGVKLSDLRHLDLRPSAISTTATLQYHETTARVVKYYENIRFVYEFESRLRELKKTNNNSGDKPAETQQPQQKPDDHTSKNPDERDQNQNYSLEMQDHVMAQLEEAPAVKAFDAGNRRDS